MSKRDPKLKDIMILFDRNLGISIFSNFRAYDNLIDDAEWLLERTQNSRGFIIRPVSDGDRNGIWIGEYDHNNNEITREDLIFNASASRLSRAILDYSEHKITEKAVMKKLAVDVLKGKIKSKIIQDFKYYTCPAERFYYTCSNIRKVYENLKKKYGGEEKVPYSLVADDVLNIIQCKDVIICPLKVHNAFERIYNFNKALKNLGIGEIIFISPGMVRIA